MFAATGRSKMGRMFIAKAWVNWGATPLGYSFYISLHVPCKILIINRLLGYV